MAMNAKIITQIVKKPLIFSIGYASADGGVLLGYERSDQTYSISASYPVWNNLTVSIGYKETDSTIDYFDTRAPVIGLQFSSISF
jgi:predicted porin